MAPSIQAMPRPALAGLARALSRAAVLAGLITAVTACESNSTIDASDVGSAGAAAVPSHSPGVCTTRRDCTYDIIGAVESVEDCACPRCPADAGATDRRTYQDRAAKFQRTCGEWARDNACAPGFCASPPKLDCVDGACQPAQ